MVPAAKEFTFQWEMKGMYTAPQPTKSAAPGGKEKALEEGETLVGLS